MVTTGDGTARAWAAVDRLDGLVAVGIGLGPVWPHPAVFGGPCRGHGRRRAAHLRGDRVDVADTPRHEESGVIRFAPE